MIGQVLSETYRLERLIGEGSMGAVYEAAHLRLRRRFAVKLLNPLVATIPQALARFQQEAEVTSGLGHPNVVEIVDFRNEEGSPYLVMELLEGEDLEQRLQRDGTLEVAEAVSILRQAASALQAVHRAGVVHRDLKPQNLFLARLKEEGEGVRVKILDFGISKVLEAEAHWTQNAQIMGTPWFMAPELAEGKAAEADPRTDIYSLGAILYAMLAGRPPFEASSLLALLYKVTHEEPTPIEELRPDVPPALAEAIRRAMHKRREERFSSALELAEATSSAMEEPEEDEDEAGTKTSIRAPKAAAPALAHTSVDELGYADTLYDSAHVASAPVLEDETVERASSRVPATHVSPRGSRRRVLVSMLILAVAVVGALGYLLAQRGDGAAPRLVEPALGPAPVASSRDLAAAPRDARVSADRVPLDQTTIDQAAPRHPSSRRAGRRKGHAGEPAGEGLLNVGVIGVPLAQVFVDGKPFGETPLQRPLKAGRHKVQVLRQGFKDYLEWVTVTTGRVTQVRAKLAPR